jgi:putative polyketide hydroxylase
MSKDRITTVPVLIVGAGPAGLATAITLGRNGVEVLLVERRNELSGLPRATVVSTRSMELMRQWGLEDRVRQGGMDVEWLELECATLAEAARGSLHAVGLPTTEQSALVSPAGAACVPQDHLEPVLLEHLKRLPGAQVRLGSEVVGLEQAGERTRTELRDVATGKTWSVESQYLIAADGAHSVVRNALGIPMRGPDRLLEAVSTVFRAPLWDVLGDRRFGLYWVTHPEATGIFLPAGRDDRWVFGVLWEPGTRQASDFTEERLAELIRIASGIEGLEPRIERFRTFRFAAQIADTFRQGRAFLVGDAAHRVTPRGGTGMNAALHDGFDLGWKLAWVLRGFADSSLLDTYERERRPAVEHNVARSADPAGSLRDAGRELHTDLGGRIPHVWMDSEQGRVSTLDVLGPSLTLLTGPASDAWRAALRDVEPRVPVKVHELDPITARALGIRRGGAQLVRPDGVRVGLWSADRSPAEALEDALAELCGKAALRVAA